MKSLISILTALLIIVVSHYADAAENGAKNAKDTKEAPPSQREPIRVSVDDFKEFSEKSLDDRVVEFRRGNEYYTMIPYSDLWFTPQREEAFEVAQTFGDKLMKVWLQKTLNLRYGEGSDVIEEEFKKLSVEQIKELLKQGGKGSTMPTAREIVEASADAREAVKKLKDRAKFHVEFDELIRAFDKNQEEIFKLRGLQSAQSKAVPRAVSFITSFKVPPSFIESIKNTRYLSGVSLLLKGSLTFSVTVRPWKMIKRNLDTGVTTESWYLESATQTWLTYNPKTKEPNISGPLRVGVGFIWGDFDKMSDINGFVLGYSKNFNVKSTSLNGALPIPSYNNVKFGTISAAVETLTQGLDFGNLLKNGYFMYTRQYGFQAPQGKSGNWDVGGVFNLANITDRVKLNQDTLEELIETVSKEVPGAQVIVRDDQVEIIIPDEKSQTEKKEETPAAPEQTEDAKFDSIRP